MGQQSSGEGLLDGGVRELEAGRKQLGGYGAGCSVGRVNHL